MALGIEKSGGQAPPPDLPARHFVGRLLAPGSFSYAALHVALTALGCDIATADLARQPVSELQQITLQVGHPQRSGSVERPPHCEGFSGQSRTALLMSYPCMGSLGM